ncbi:trigger factor family protein [bacterium]|nr:trigger factor family protein [bacterium]
MHLKVKHKEINPIQHELKIEFGWEEVEKHIPDILNEFKENTDIKGFRKGKAPENVVRAQIGEKRILERAAEKAAYDAFNEAIKDSASSTDSGQEVDPTEQKSTYPQPIAPPEIDLDEIKEGEPVSFTAKYCIQPPDPTKLADEYKKKHTPEIISPEDVFPQGPPNIHSHGPYSVPTDVLRNIPGVDLGDKFIPNASPQIPNPEGNISSQPGTQPEIPDPESYQGVRHQTIARLICIIHINCNLIYFANPACLV